MIRLTLADMQKYIEKIREAPRCEVHGRSYLAMCAECGEIACYECDGSCHCTDDKVDIENW